MDQNHGSENSYNYSSSALHFPLISNNSFELNAISLSDDSGFTSSNQNRENEVSFVLLWLLIDEDIFLRNDCLALF